MADHLGPAQSIWDAWDQAQAEIKAKPLSHFEFAVRKQFEEIETHLKDGNRQKAANEAVDIISIALNVLRWLDYEPEEVERTIRSRAENRMRGQALAILDSYQRRYGV